MRRKAEDKQWVCGVDFYVRNSSGCEGLRSEIAEICRSMGMKGNVSIKRIESEDDDDDGVWMQVYEILLVGESTKVVEVTEYHHYRGDAGTKSIIRVPSMAAKGDLTLSFALLKAIKEHFRDSRFCKGWWNREQIEIDEALFQAMDEGRRAALRKMIEKSEGRNRAVIRGMRKEIYVETRKEQPEMSEEELIDRADKTFVELQWNYGDYKEAALVRGVARRGKEYTARVLENRAAFVGGSEKVMIYSGTGEIKVVGAEKLREHVSGNKHFRMVDTCQMVMEEMTEEEWKTLYDSIKGETRKAKTYLLRWNPTISSMTISDYREASMDGSRGFSWNWSVYEWEEAHAGDLFYMLRTGDDKSGIVFAGRFLSEPEEGEDWAGKGRQRHYMDFECWGCVDAKVVPPVDLEKLEKEIPSIDWRTGHSGQLMTEEEAEKMEKLWKGKKGKGEKKKGSKRAESVKK